MVRQFGKRLSVWSRQALFLLVLGGLVIGLASRDRQMTPPAKSRPAATATTDRDTAPRKGMAGHQLPVPVTTAFVATAPSLPQHQSDGHRHACAERSALSGNATAAFVTEATQLTSLGLVSAVLNHRHTLVGARPSGTS